MPDPLASLRQALQDRYEIERELGRGGMATVYLARDLRHVREGERAMELQPISASLNFGTYVQELLARIYVMAGQPDKAIERLRAVLAVPSHMSRDRLRIDPHFTPLRDHPQFRRLVEGAT